MKRLITMLETEKNVEKFQNLVGTWPSGYIFQERTFWQ